jgi:hypothetical protein
MTVTEGKVSEPQKWLLNVWVVRIIRIVILGFSWSSFIITFALGGDFGFTFSTYTYQSNLMVLIWLTLAVILQERNSDHWFFSEKIRGAITLYITVTFIIFAILLAPLYHPTGIAAYQNLVLHYLIPVAFILDWVLTESRRDYNWTYIIYWLVYPLCYLVFSIIREAITHESIYYFLSMSEYGVPIFIAICFGLAGFFLGLGALYVFINKKVR